MRKRKMPDMNKKEAGELLKAIAKEYGFNVIEVEPDEGGIFYKGKKLSIEEIFEEFKDWEWEVNDNGIKSITKRKN